MPLVSVGNLWFQVQPGLHNRTSQGYPVSKQKTRRWSTLSCLVLAMQSYFFPRGPDSAPARVRKLRQEISLNCPVTKEIKEINNKREILFPSHGTEDLKCDLGWRLFSAIYPSSNNLWRHWDWEHSSRMTCLSCARFWLQLAALQGKYIFNHLISTRSTIGLGHHRRCMVTQTFNTCTWEIVAGRYLCEFQAI